MVSSIFLTNNNNQPATLTQQISCAMASTWSVTDTAGGALSIGGEVSILGKMPEAEGSSQKGGKFNVNFNRNWSTAVQTGTTKTNTVTGTVSVPDVPPGASVTINVMATRATFSVPGFFEVGAKVKYPIRFVGTDYFGLSAEVIGPGGNRSNVPVQ